MKPLAVLLAALLAAAPAQAAESDREAGDRLLRAGQLKAAAQRFERADAHQRAVDVLGRLGAFERAETHLTQAVAEAGKDKNRLASALTDLGHLRYRQDRHQEAVTLYQRALAVASPDGVEATMARYHLGETLLELDRYPEAEAALRPAIAAMARLDLDDLGEAYQALALVRHLQGDPAQALSLAEEGVKRDRRPGHEAALVERLSGLGMVYVLLGQGFDKGNALVDEALGVAEQLNREDLVALVKDRRAELARFQGRNEAALRDERAALVVFHRLGQLADEATVVANMASLYAAWDKPDQARAAFDQALDLERRMGRKLHEANLLHNVGSQRTRAGAHDEALGYFAQALTLHRTLARGRWEVLDQQAIAGARFAKADFKGAIGAYQEALTAARRAGLIDMEAGSYAGMAGVYTVWCRYDLAVRYAEQALALHKRLGKQVYIPGDLDLLATAYLDWGQADKAIATYEEARAIHLSLGNAAMAADVDARIAGALVTVGRRDRAIAAYEAAAKVFRQLGQTNQLAYTLRRLGDAHRQFNEPKAAIARYEAARALYAALGQDGDVAACDQSLGGVYRDTGAYDQAQACFERTLAANRKQGNDFAAMLTQAELARLAHARGDHAGAVPAYRQAIAMAHSLKNGYLEGVWSNELAFPLALTHRFHDASQAARTAVDRFETIRETATGEARRDYLAKQISYYQDLVLFLSYEDRQEEAFAAMEQGRARLLAETLAARGAQSAPPSLEEVKRALAPDTLLLGYTQNRGFVLQMACDRATSTLDRVRIDEKFHPPGADAPAARPADPSRGVALEVEDERAPATLDEAVRRYRALLRSPAAADQAQARAYGRAFYDLLVAPHAARLARATELLVVPDGELGTLPFETLVDPQGRYLAERFRLRYVQSLTVWNQLRTRAYPATRKPLLALGGAVYAPVPSSEAAPSAAGLGKWLDQAFADDRSLRPAYRTLGVTGWADLPGTRAEVAAIARAVPGAETMLGPEVAEDTLRVRSDRGELARYKVLHVAAHGLVVPGTPALSALVLSQRPTERGAEDGYVRMAELATLKLQADFVALSACETGLGAVYGGEGVVGLAQSLLVAGANGASVSLWQVADASTAQLMTALYQEAAKSRVGYAEALARVKRRFIAGEFGEQYRQPYYWAPFVYWGR